MLNTITITIDNITITNRYNFDIIKGPCYTINSNFVILG